MPRIHVGGRFKFANLEKKDQEDIVKRLEKRHPGLAGGGLGIKIDGKEVTPGNVKDFEGGIKPVKKSVRKRKKRVK